MGRGVWLGSQGVRAGVGGGVGWVGGGTGQAQTDTPSNLEGPGSHPKMQTKTPRGTRQTPCSPKSPQKVPKKCQKSVKIVPKKSPGDQKGKGHPKICRESAPRGRGSQKRAGGRAPKEKKHITDFGGAYSRRECGRGGVWAG